MRFGSQKPEFKTKKIESHPLQTTLKTIKRVTFTI